MPWCRGAGTKKNHLLPPSFLLPRVPSLGSRRRHAPTTIVEEKKEERLDLIISKLQLQF